jgi:hypothetical protein
MRSDQEDEVVMEGWEPFPGCGCGVLHKPEECPELGGESG